MLDRLALVRARRPTNEQTAYRYVEQLLARQYVQRPPPKPVEERSRVLAISVLQHLGRIFERENRNASAALCILVSYQLAPSHKVLAKAVALAERAKCPEDAFILAQLMVERATEVEDRKQAWGALARVLEELLNRHPEAADVFSNAFLEFPEASEFLSGLARCLEGARRYSELVEVIRTQISREKNEGQLALLHTRLGSLLETVLGDDEKASTHYREAMSLAAGFEPPVQSLLALAEKRGDWETVVEVLRTRARSELRPKERATVFTRLGEILAVRLNNVTEAVSYLERAIREYPRSLPARLMLLELLCKQGQYARAERFATPPDGAESQGLSPSQLTRLLQMRAKVANERGRPTEALECFALAIEIAPKPIDVLDALLELIRRQEPEIQPPEVLGRMAAFWEKKGQSDLAAKALQAEGLLFLHWGNLELAENRLMRSAQAFPNDPANSDALAELYYVTRRFQDAVNTLLSSIRSGTPQEATCTLRAAEILREHLHRPEEALALLEHLHKRGAASAASCLYAANLALILGRLRDAQQTVELARGRIQPEDRPEVEALSVELGKARRLDATALHQLRLKAAHAGEPNSLQTVCQDWLSMGDSERVTALLGSLPKEQLGTAFRILGDLERAFGHSEVALEYYRSALWTDEAGLELIEGMSMIAPKEALIALERYLQVNPFEVEALSLLSSLLNLMGESAGAHSLYDFASMLHGGVRVVPVASLETFWSSVRVSDPFIAFLQELRQSLPRAFRKVETSIFNASQEILLPRNLVKLIEPICEERGIAFPQILANPDVGSEPICLEEPAAIVISPKLVQPDMPEGSLLFATLLGVAKLGSGAAPLTYLAMYQLDVIGEVLRQVSTSKNANLHSWNLLVNVMTASKDEIDAVAKRIDLSKPVQFSDPLVTKVVAHERVVQGVLSVTGDLVSALAAISLEPPPTFSLNASRFRWLKHLSRNPTARSALHYTLSNHFAALQSRPVVNLAASA